jgi:hypothetical protein
MQKIVDVPGATICLLFNTPQYYLTLPISKRGLWSLSSPEASTSRLHTAAEVWGRGGESRVRTAREEENWVECRDKRFLSLILVRQELKVSPFHLFSF